MVALALWLLLVAAIGTVVVIGVVRPARRSGHQASTVFTRRASRRARRPEGPVRSADERARTTRRPRRTRSAPVAAPAVAQPPTAGERAETQVASSSRPASAESSPEPAHEDPRQASFPAGPSSRSAAAAQPAASTADGVHGTDTTVIDARTRWAETPGGSQEERSARGVGTEGGVPTTQVGELRKAE